MSRGSMHCVHERYMHARDGRGGERCLTVSDRQQHDACIPPLLHTAAPTSLPAHSCGHIVAGDAVPLHGDQHSVFAEAHGAPDGARAQQVRMGHEANVQGALDWRPLKG